MFAVIQELSRTPTVPLMRSILIPIGKLARFAVIRKAPHRTLILMIATQPATPVGMMKEQSHISTHTIVIPTVMNAAIFEKQQKSIFGCLPLPLMKTHILALASIARRLISVNTFTQMIAITVVIIVDMRELSHIPTTTTAIPTVTFAVKQEAHNTSTMMRMIQLATSAVK